METTQRPALSRRKRKEATRQALLRAAMSCFRKKGFRATQIADIAREAGVAHGTFYVHFRDKEELLGDELARFNEGFLERVAGLGVPGDLEGAVRLFAREFLAYWGEGRAFVRAYAEKVAHGISVEQLRDGINPPAVEFLTEALAGLARERGARDVELRLVVQGLLAMWLRVGLQVLLGPEAGVVPAVRKAEDTLVRLTLGALEGVMPAARR